MDPSYNNTFGSFDANSGQVAQKKKHTGLIVGIVLLFFLCIVGVLAFIFVNNGNKNNVIESKRNTFVNLVKSGERDAKNPGEITLGVDWYINENYSNTDYIDDLISVFDDFQKEAVTTEEYSTTVQFAGIRERLLFLRDYHELPEFTTSSIQQMYSSDGKDMLESYVGTNLMKGKKDQEDEDFNNFLETVRNDEFTRILTVISKIETSSSVPEFLEYSEIEKGIDYSISFIKNQCETIMIAEGISNEQ